MRWTLRHWTQILPRARLAEGDAALSRGRPEGPATAAWGRASPTRRPLRQSRSPTTRHALADRGAAPRLAARALRGFRLPLDLRLCFVALAPQSLGSLPGGRNRDV